MAKDNALTTPPSGLLQESQHNPTNEEIEAILPSLLGGRNMQLVMKFLTFEAQSVEEQKEALVLFASALEQEKASRNAVKDMKHVSTDGEFDREMSVVGASPVCVAFFGEGGQCKKMAPFFEKFSRTYPTVTFIKVDGDNCQDTSARFSVTAMPTFIMVVGGQEVDSVRGAYPSNLNRMVKRSVVGTLLVQELDLGTFRFRRVLPRMERTDRDLLVKFLKSESSLSLADKQKAQRVLFHAFSGDRAKSGQSVVYGREWYPVVVPPFRCYPTGGEPGTWALANEKLTGFGVPSFSLAAIFSTRDPEARFDDLKEIGHGSFGAVFYAYDKERGETVAIKKMSYTGKTAIEKWNDVIKEIQFLTSLHHANIVEYRSSFLKDSTCWLVMEYCIGSAADLVDVLKKGLREVEIAAICHCTLAALAYLHGLGRIHRDGKAGNILLTDAGIVKLADFGSASMTSPAHTFIGTPFFMAPEVILAMEDGQYAERADIWSMGITAIELAERRPPLFSMNAMSALYHIAQNEPPTLAQEDGATWSPAIKSFIASCLQKEASKRMTADQAREHPFVKNAYAPHILSELIARTKRLVRDLDNYQYKKLRKLMLLVGQKEGDNGTEDGDSSLAGGADSLSVSGCTTEDSLSRDDAGGDESSRGGAESPSSRSNSLTSLHSLQSVSGSSGRVTPQGKLHNATVVSVAESMESGVGGSSGISAEISMRNAKEEVNTLRRFKFSTLRSTKKIITEVEEYRRFEN